MYKITGIKKINYTSKKTGRPVSGLELHCSYESKDIYGHGSDKFYISEKTYAESGYDIDNVNEINDLIGKTVKFFYNRFGNVDGFQIIGE